MAFRKGEGGRPLGATNRAGREAALLFKKLGGPNGKRYAQQLHELAVGKHDDVHARIKALAIIAPYIWGKPTETHQLIGEGGGPVIVKFVDAA